MTSSLLQRVQLNDASVTKLDLRGQYLTDAEMAELVPALQNYSHVKVLKLDENQLGDLGASELAAVLRQNSTLRTLSVSKNYIGAQGASDLAAALRRNSVLQTLDLSGNQIGDLGASTILNALTHNYSLTWINLESNNISEPLKGNIYTLVKANKNGMRRRQAWWTPDRATPARMPTPASHRYTHERMQRRSNSAASLGTSHPCMWAISYEQLLGILEKSKAYFRRRNENFAAKTMRDINTHIVENWCRKYGTSVALRLNPEGLKADTFVTHSWDEPFEDFVASIKSHFRTSMAKPNLWICTFALKQGDAEYTTQQLDVPLESSPFVLALQEAESFLVVRNSMADVYQRLWCVCELFFAKQCGLVPRRAYVAGPNSFQHSRTTFAKATASDNRDHNRILRYLYANGNEDEIDEIIQTLRSHVSNI